MVSTNGTLRRNVSDSSFTVSGDSASNTGANINLYGASHSSLANVFRVTTSTERLRVTSAGNLFVAGTGGMNTTQLPNGRTINVNGTSSNDGLSVIRYSTGYGAYGLNIGRSKSDTLGTNAAVTNGNDLGHISFYGADGTDFNMAAQITAQVDGTPSDGTDMPGRLVFKTSSDGSATPTERLRIFSDGIVRLKSDGSAANKARFRINEKWNNNATDFGIDFERTYDTGGDDQDAGYIHVKRDGAGSDIVEWYLVLVIELL